MPKSLPHAAPVRANIRAVQQACRNLSIPFEVHDDYENFISIQRSRPYFFVNFAVPFNDSAVSRICKDKEFTWRLLSEHIRMPRTKGYFDPKPQNEGYFSYVKERGYGEIAQSIVKEFSLPLVVKMNAGSLGTNVFLCKSEEEVLAALKAIFNHDSASYDYVALGQEYIERKNEYRVVVFRGEILLLYEKDFAEATFAGNLSPLHYENAVARHLEDPALKARIQDFIEPVFSVMNLEFGGLDIVIDTNDQMYLLEINSQPGFSYFVRDNGEEKLVEMYEKMLKQLQ